jgi:hypothetical protein
MSLDCVKSVWRTGVEAVQRGELENVEISNLCTVHLRLTPTFLFQNLFHKTFQHGTG